MSLDFTLESLVSNTDDNVAPIATAAFFGYLANILINARQIPREKLEDYPGCGQRLADPGLYFESQDDECTWNCQWVDAPFIKDPNFVGRSTAKKGRQVGCTFTLNGLDCPTSGDSKISFIKNTELDMYFVFNLLKLPKDLSCLYGCSNMFYSFWRDSCLVLEETTVLDPITGQEETTKEYVYYNKENYKDDSRDFYNCYMDKRRLSTTEFDFLKIDKDVHVTRDFQDVAFEICYLAFIFKDQIKVAEGDFGETYGLCEDFGLIPYNIPPYYGKKFEVITEEVNGKIKVNSKRKENGKGKDNGTRKVNDKRKVNAKRKVNGERKENSKRKENAKRKVNGKIKGKRKVNGKYKDKKKNKTPKRKRNPKGKRFNQLFRNHTSDNSGPFWNGGGDRLSGPLGFINLNSQKFTTGYPWMCSLRTTGFRGSHKCGVTLLSGPPKATILVGAAHCNYVCRNEEEELLEMCCCGDGSNQLSSCKSKSYYCSGRPLLKEARSQDLQIVCGEHNIGQVPEHISWENEIILDIKKIMNHENFQPGKPLQGSDIAVYLVDESQAKERMKMYSPLEARIAADIELFFSAAVDSEGNFDYDKYFEAYDDPGFEKKYNKINLQSFGKMILPACLPREKYLPDKESGIFSSWKDPKPGYISPTADFDNFNLFNKFTTTTTTTTVPGASTTSTVPTSTVPKPQEDIADFFNTHGAASLSYDVWPHHVRLDKHPCKDPDWMESKTYYPAGTTCYRDPSAQSCMLFGSSGSGLLRPFGYEKTTASQIQITSEFTYDQIKFGYGDDYDDYMQLLHADAVIFTNEKFGYVGPLSLYKGCDRAGNINFEDVVVNKNEEDELNNVSFDDEGIAKLEPQKWLMMYGGDNVAVFTDANCFLDWIAEQYNMDPPAGWKKPDSCLKSTGDPKDKDKETCKSADSSTCDFSSKYKLHVNIGAYETNITMDKCYLLDVGGGYADNINMCVNKKGQLDHCANNCKGVDANSVVAGGIGALVVANSALTSLLGPAAGVATLGVGAVGGQAALMMMNHMRRPANPSRRRPRRCSRPTPTRPCRDAASGRCCRVFVRGGRRRCPRTC